MTVLVFTNNFGGLHSFRKEVIQAILEKGYRVVISAPFDEKTHFFEEMGCELKNTVFDRKGMNPIKDFVLMLRYRNLIKEFNPDVVLSYTIKPNLYGGMACQLCGIPQLANITGLGAAVENPGWLQQLTIFLYKVGLHKTHMVFFQNKANMEFFRLHKMMKGQMKLIPGSGVNLQRHYLQDYPSPNEPIRFLFVSRLLKQKGIEDFLAASCEIKAKYPETEFHILGRCEGDYADKIDQLQKDGVVIYHGMQIDVRPYIGKAWCIVHPSYYPEGMSNVLLESCAAGRPVITTNRPGCGEIVDEGLNGFVIKPRDGHDVALKIEKFIQLPYEKKREMGLAARHKVEKEFDRKIVVKAYLDAIAGI